ncbi:MAG: hypothetical protein CMM48_14195 [Rhodospirillaceae bacterium]|nr:hypothetical protein [Rhodospirillaceae bacterium]
MTENLGDLFKGNLGNANPAVIDLADPARPIARSYAELDTRADEVAAGLAKLGVGRGATVGILALNRVEFIEVFFGIMRAGAVPVPVNVKLPAETVRYILEDSATAVNFVDGIGEALLPDDAKAVNFDSAYEGFLCPGGFSSVPVDDTNLCGMPYTSGTTGKPKGVYLTHAGQDWAARSLVEHRRLTADERILISAPFFHKNALVAIKTAMLPGATLVTLPRFDPRQALQAIHEHRVTMMTGVPTMLYMLMAETDLVESLDLSSVTTVSMGSAPASDRLIERIHETFPNSQVQFNYGITEGGPLMVGWFHPEGKTRPLGSVGYPMPRCEYRFEGGPDKMQGELIVRNPGIAIGYHNLPEATSEKFQDGWFRTGDILREDEDGWLYFVGRVDDMFVCSGENIFPSEVVLRLERHPAIAQAVVLPFDDERRGQVPFAFIKRVSGEPVDEDEVKQYALAEGPAYAHPRRVFFVEDFPLSGTNKIDTVALRRLAESDGEGTDA